jgi:hypothetical protein
MKHLYLKQKLIIILLLLEVTTYLWAQNGQTTAYVKVTNGEMVTWIPITGNKFFDWNNDFNVSGANKSGGQHPAIDVNTVGELDLSEIYSDAGGSGTKYEVKEIYTDAFNNCRGLTRVIVPEGCTRIANRAFYLCTGLNIVELPSSLTYLGEQAFSYSGLTAIMFPKGLKTLGREMFYSCRQLSSVSLPDDLEEIQAGAFSGCLSLKTITLPSSLKTIGPGAFYGCYSLESVVTFIVEPFTIVKNVFYGGRDEVIYNNTTLFVPMGTSQRYATTEAWSYFQNIVEGAPSGIGYNTIGSGTMKRYNLGGVRIHEGQKGLNIILMNDGKPHKYVVK